MFGAVLGSSWPGGPKLAPEDENYEHPGSRLPWRLRIYVLCGSSRAIKLRIYILCGSSWAMKLRIYVLWGSCWAIS